MGELHEHAADHRHMIPVGHDEGTADRSSGTEPAASTEDPADQAPNQNAGTDGRSRTVQRGNGIVDRRATDQLTGLLTRQAFLDDLSEVLHRGLREPGVVIYLNLVNFKFFNSRHGIEDGNRVLRMLADLLREQFDNGLLSRIANDHFAVFTVEEGTDAALDRIHRRLADVDEARELQLKAGIRKVEPGTTLSAVTLCDHAKLAGDVIKTRSDLYRFEYFSDLSHDAERNAYIVAQLDEAIASGHITVHFQPIVRTMTRKLCAFEALARWEDPVYGIISPETFIPVLESARAIHKLDVYVIREVCRTLREHIDAGKRVVPVSFNLSRVDFLSHDLRSIIDRTVSEFHIPHGLLRVEITESVFTGDQPLIIGQMDMLREAGFEIWMDDFGSGYSSLSFLDDCPFDGIKFDARLVRNLNDRGKTVLKSMVEMSKALDSSTLAEGVETQEQVEFLESIGCEMIQGVLLRQGYAARRRPRPLRCTGPVARVPRRRPGHAQGGRHQHIDGHTIGASQG
jgi:diguanylate cyclase (GGDEF)-like protein